MEPVEDIKSSTSQEATFATIYDVAELAGVSASTVSRALSTPGRISPNTEAKVRDAAKKLSYQVNPFARALPTGKTKMIALMVSDITNPVFFDITRGAESVADEFGYTLVIAESQESGSNEASALTRILPTVDAVILVTTRLSDSEIKRLNQRKPLILLNRVVPEVADVVPDNRPGITQLISHLYQQGHNSIAYLGGPGTSWMNQNRWKLLMQEATTKGMSIVEIGPNPPNFSAGIESFDRVVASGVTAVVCFNDLMAIGLMRAAQDNGRSIPEDLSIVGFDNIFGSEFTNPALTTVGQPGGKVGDKAMRKLIALLEQSALDDPSDSTDLETKLIIRESSSKAASS